MTGFLFLRLLGDDLSLILHHAPKTSTGVLMGKPELAVIREVTFSEKGLTWWCALGVNVVVDEIQLGNETDVLVLEV